MTLSRPTHVLLVVVLIPAGNPAPATLAEAPARVPGHAEAPCPEPDARAFDFWAGEWDVQNRHRRPDADDPTWFDTGRATARVYAVLQGCAIVEHWRGEVNGSELVGFSVRAFNPVSRQWDLVLLWPQPERPAFWSMQGGFRHGRGEFFFERPDQQGHPQRNRYSFSDITDSSLRWDVAVSGDAGLTWRTNWIMEFTRRPAEATPLLNGRASAPTRCTFPGIRELDFLQGRWRGSSEADGVTSHVSIESVPILDGCGAMDFVEIRDGEDRIEAFHVRTFEPASNQWVEYRADTVTRVLHRLNGTLADGVASFSGRLVSATGEATVASTWRRASDTSVRWTWTRTPETAAGPALDLAVTLERR